MEAAMKSSMVVSLDGDGWIIAKDPDNVGRDRQWWDKPTAEAEPIQVPAMLQQVFNGYHGVVWYWRDVTFPTNPHTDGRYLIRFWRIDYLADVWVNGTFVGHHEGKQDPFVLDVTEAAKPESSNRIAIRILSTGAGPAIDGIEHAAVPHLLWPPDSNANSGGILDSVELMMTTPVRIEDLFVKPDWRTGMIKVQAYLQNAATKGPTRCRLLFTVAPAYAGETLHAVSLDQELPSGGTEIQAELAVGEPHLWNLNDPYLYRVTAKVIADGSDSFDEQSTRCGFRDFRFENGYFRLNGKRIYLKSSHAGMVSTPITWQVPLDPDMVRRVMLNCKVMGFNMYRSFDSMPPRYLLDLCDEIGLMVYEEHMGEWGLLTSRYLPERLATSVGGMIRRDRNHPCIVMWGLLNETFNDPTFHYVVSMLPFVRTLDDSRVVMLNSGRFDGYTPAYGSIKPAVWYSKPWYWPAVLHNGTKETIGYGDAGVPAGRFALIPGVSGEYSVAQWTVPVAAEYSISASFEGITGGGTTTDIHIFLNDNSIYDGFLNLNGVGNTATFEKILTLQKEDRVSAVVGAGNGVPYGDTTALTMMVKSAEGKVYDAAADFSTQSNPNGAWNYGFLARGEKPDLATFTPYTTSDQENAQSIGSLSNPGSTEWEDVLADHHPYQRVPHTAVHIGDLRNRNPGQPLFISEYGIGSPMDLVRTMRHYEQLGNTTCEDAMWIRGYLDKFMIDWENWKMADTFSNPEAYFRQCIARMAGQRQLGLNAIRANPYCVGYNMTGTFDGPSAVEGAVATWFRELKPGAADALYEGFYPLRLCLFAEPVNVYRGTKVRFEGVLANEDVMIPGEYPVRFQIVGPDCISVYDKTILITIPDPKSNPDPPLAMPIFGEDIAVDGPSGKYQFLASFQQGGAAAGGEVEFYVADPADMPDVETEITLWGEDADVAQWLAEHGIKTRLFQSGKQTSREVILVGYQPPSGDAAVWRELADHIARGSTVIFLSPDVFKRGDNPTGWVPLVHKGSVGNAGNWLYHADQWTKKHPIFDGLPCGGLMDYTFYREIISDLIWRGQETPAEIVAVAVNASLGYDSGFLVSVYNLGAGKFVLNTLAIRGNPGIWRGMLGTDPVAERLLRNMLRYGSRDLQKDLAERPADFDQYLSDIGYGK